MYLIITIIFFLTLDKKKKTCNDNTFMYLSMMFIKHDD